MVYALVITIVAILAIAGAVTLLEHDGGQSNTKIDGFATALWWAIVTVTTVGYGDITPVTLGGRALGVVLMIGGIGIFGIFTASVAALFVEGNDDTDPAPRHNRRGAARHSASKSPPSNSASRTPPLQPTPTLPRSRTPTG